MKLKLRPTPLKMAIHEEEEDDDANNSIQFNSMIYYLCAESTAIKPITDTAQ
jgi:hypothetical protein